MNFIRSRNVRQRETYGLMEGEPVSCCSTVATKRCAPTWRRWASTVISEKTLGIFHSLLATLRIEAENIRCPQAVTNIGSLFLRFSIFGNSASPRPQELTPNDAYFVRWHYAGLPTSIGLRTFRLSVAGAVTRSLQLP